MYRRLPRTLRIALVHGYTPNFSVGAICIVERADGALLLVRHSYRARWGFPGGLLKRGEDVRTAARREALEEVCLPVELVDEPAVVVEAPVRRVDVIFRCRPAPDADLSAVRPVSPEIVETRWFPPDALPELQHEASGALVALARASSVRRLPPLSTGVTPLFGRREG